ncbi:two-component sensor histidine kinase [Streptacidiphilus pinicola]|uniref:Signal transduction histidine-protein kinase/phosphatase MprB n=1 Tax=Streptacidiphilus pinicola TaxID=2219663 RepID=A0A2X0IV97_9ACTN|nr:ATP-binding protein [Streptacidiphilus pinicola]RAG87473.1 two-component sensor histidine kinase [Streptacidiphilus pinicola]
MKRRLLNSTLAVVLVTVALFSVPLALVEKRSIESAASDAVKTEALHMIGVIENRHAANEPIDRAALTGLNDSGSGRYAVVHLPGDATPIVIGSKPAGSDPVTATETGPHGETVVVQESSEPVDNAILRMLLLLVGVAALTVAAAMALAGWQAKRITRPLTELAETAERLGSGDPRPRRRRYGMAELDRVGEVLDQSADRIGRMLTAERRLAADASHQLRTPLTALSMRLEEIVETDDLDTVKEEAAIALGQVERLTDVVQRLLTNSRESRNTAAVAFDVDEVIKQQTEEWRPALRRYGRKLYIEGPPGLWAVGTPGAVAQVIAALIENSLMHGDGSVTIRTRVRDTRIVIEIQDEGAGVPDELGARVFERAVSGHNSTGIGLAVARDLAEADGGRLELLSQRPPVFALFLGRQES